MNLLHLYAFGFGAVVGAAVVIVVQDVWDWVNRTEVLAVFEDAEIEPTPIYDGLAGEHPIVGRLAAFEAERALTDDRIAAFLDGWATEDDQA